MSFEKRYFIFFFLITASALSIQNPRSNDRAFDRQEMIQTLIDQTQRHLETVYTVLSDLSVVINDNQIPSFKQKAKTLKTIRTFMQDLESKKNVLVVSTDLKTIQFIIQYTQAAIDHLTAILAGGCTTFSPFDSKPLIESTRSQAGQPELPALHTTITTNETRLTNLIMLAHSAGLHWYNKAYRMLDAYCLHYMREYGLVTAGTVSLLSYAYWHMYGHRFKGSWIGIPYTPESLRPQTNNNGGNAQPTLDNPQLKFLGRAEHFLASYGSQLLPFGSFLLYLIKDSITAHWKTRTEPWLYKKISSAHYTLMGGSYVQKASKLDGIGKKVLFDDLIGLAHAKDECTYLINYMKDPETYIRRGQKINHILFTGPPRTGKTELAKALYCEIKQLHATQMKFIPLPAALINMKGIDWCLEIIKYHAPCVVFIDEIDLLNLQRSGKNQELSALLQGMSGLDNDSDPTKQVIIIGATNKPEYLDFALMTHGRFGKVIHFEYPNLKERIEFFTRQMKKMALNLTHFNIKQLARETDGKSYEALKTLLDHGILKARLAGQSLMHHHLEAALDEELRHIVYADLKQIPEHEQQLLAAHFAGHALALHLIGCHTKLAKVTIKPIMAKLKEELIGKDLWQGAMGKESGQQKEQERYQYGHTFLCHDQDTIQALSYDERTSLCKFHLAGIAAEKILLGHCGYSCHCNDKQEAFDMIAPIVFEGIDPEAMPQKLRTAKYELIMKQLEQYEQEVSALLSSHLAELENIMIELKAQETLDAKTIAEIVKDTQEDS